MQIWKHYSMEQFRIRPKREKILDLQYSKLLIFESGSDCYNKNRNPPTPGVIMSLRDLKLFIIIPIFLDLKSNLFFFFFLFMATSVAYGTSGLGVKSESQMYVYATATATPNPSHTCERCYSLWQYWILNPLSKARDPNQNLTLCWVLNPLHV